MYVISGFISYPVLELAVGSTVRGSSECGGKGRRAEILVTI